MGKRPSSFHLRKWYLDCISETGQTVIGYSAELAWKSLALSYASCLTSGVSEAVQTNTSLMREKPPEMTGEKIIRWTSDRLSCSGSWHPRLADALPPLRLYEDEAGYVSWHCLQPLSEARVQLQEEEVHGLGYVELLEVTLPPWKLPLKELHWGRFLSPDASLVWIQWLGSHPLSLAFLNGKRIEGVHVSETQVAWEGGVLDLYDHMILRSGPLVHTALAKIPGINAIFPERVLQTKECKWRSRGKLEHQGMTETGWTIHEIVQSGSMP